jgi:S-formylglutathione hydrolase
MGCTSPPRPPTSLAGLTCTEDTGPQKSHLLSPASKHGIAIVFPDTSPRGAGVKGEEDDWDFGTGAGFYLNATKDEWKRNYNMEEFVTKELRQAVEAELPVVSLRNWSVSVKISDVLFPFNHVGL